MNGYKPDNSPKTLIVICTIMAIFAASIMIAGMTCGEQQQEGDTIDVAPGEPDSTATMAAPCDSASGTEPPPPDVRTGSPE